jgi:hypothetical protein
MLIVLIVESLEHALKVIALLDRNSLQLIIISNSYAKVVANKAKVCYFKFVAKLLFKGVNNGFTANDFNVVYID